MIVLFPMLVSKSVSLQTIPGICKTLEKFILVYKMDDVLGALGMIGSTIGAAKSMIAYSGLARRSEGSNLLEVTAREKELGDEKSALQMQLKNANAELRDINSKDIELDRDVKRVKINQGIEQTAHLKASATSDVSRMKGEKEKSDLERTKAQIDSLQSQFSFNIEFPRNDTLTIEPTWVTISGRSGSHIIGIKVVPFPISRKADIETIKWMTMDLGLRKIDKIITSFSRRVIRVLFTLANKFKIPYYRKRVINEDPLNTILFAKTEHGTNVFLCLNYSDVNDSKMVLNAVGVSKLFRLGWNSFVIADDVNKRATFCMNEFKGMCSTVPYTFLHASVSREVSRVFDNIEDVRTSASPFFRMSTKMSKVLGESVAYRKLDNYLNSL